MLRKFAVVCEVLFLVGECLFACEKQPVHFQAVEMSHRIFKRTPMLLQGHGVRIKGTIELLVVVGIDGRPPAYRLCRNTQSSLLRRMRVGLAASSMSGHSKAKSSLCGRSPCPAGLWLHRTDLPKLPRGT